MYIRKLILAIRVWALSVLLLITMLCITGCSNGSSPSDSDDDKELIEKSSKRGLAYNLVDPADLEALKSGVSWWYNWHFKPNAPDGYYDDFQIEFIPMLWDDNYGPLDIAETKNIIIDNPEIKYLLVLNEPNLTDQANKTPQQAAADWPFFEQVIEDLEARGREIKLVGPQMNWGTMTGYEDPVVWLDAFYDAYKAANSGQDPLIDYIGFHWYDYGLEDQLNRLQKYGKQIWITEMANWNPQINSYVKQAQQMQEMVALCESRQDVFRYAWFIGRGFGDKFSELFNPTPGELNSLGDLYISLPYGD